MDEWLDDVASSRAGHLPPINQAAGAGRAKKTHRHHPRRHKHHKHPDKHDYNDNEDVPSTGIADAVDSVVLTKSRVSELDSRQGSTKMFIPKLPATARAGTTVSSAVQQGGGNTVVSRARSPTRSQVRSQVKSQVTTTTSRARTPSGYPPGKPWDKPTVDDKNHRNPAGVPLNLVGRSLPRFLSVYNPAFNHIGPTDNQVTYVDLSDQNEKDTTHHRKKDWIKNYMEYMAMHGGTLLRGSTMVVGKPA